MQASAVRKLDLNEALALLRSSDAPPMWIFDQQTLAFLYVNEAAIEHYGYSRADFSKLTILDIRPVEDVTHVVRETLDPGQNRPSFREKWRHKAKDGTVFLVEITSWQLKYHDHSAELVCATPVADSEQSAKPVLELSIARRQHTQQ